VQECLTIDDELHASFRIPHDGRPGYLVVLTAYVDESGQESNEYVFIGGFLGNDNQWKQFANEWKLGLGNRKSLHMRELRWAHPRTKKLLERLGPIPYKCKLEPIAGGVHVKHYEDLIKGTIDEQLMAGYIAALYPMIIQTLRWIPKNERLELILEAQQRYEPLANIVLSNIANNQHEEFMLTNEGKSKLANWRFVPKGTTSLTEPADYLVYFLTQMYRDQHSERTKLCSPIECGDGYIGKVMSREQVRGIVQVTRTMVNWEMIRGMDLKPKTPADQARFDKLVQQVIKWEKAHKA
jgi:hypothetical protein